MKINFLLLSLLFCMISSVQAQDTLYKKRMKTLVITESVSATVGLIGLNKLWYSDYPKSKFHFINDNAAWLQMDKVGHFTSSYYIGSLGAGAMQWAGANKKNQLLYGATTGFAFLTIVEIMDGYSNEWGASLGDVLANATGTSIYIGQELLWQEQRIIPKYSFHTTSFAAQRPNVLGDNFIEQVLKDYNGQAYWLSTNISSFFPKSQVPKWLNIAIGYGANGMISAYDENLTTRTRQFYLSLDIDLRKIKTQSKLLKTVFNIVNVIKIPAPTLAIENKGKLRFYPFYF